MKAKDFCFALVAILVAPLTATAADLGRPAYKTPIQPIEPVFSWTGFYVGVNTGYLWGKSHWSGTAGNFDVDPKGWMLGGTLGYNYQTGSWVWGIEGDIDYVNAKATNAGLICNGCKFKDTWLGTVRGRIGYSFGHWLPYFTGGGAFGNEYIADTTGASGTKTQAGWTVGGGVEYAFLNNWSAKLEYLYVDLGSTTCGTSACGSHETVDFTSNIVRAGINYRF